jgi:hypothetical protein
VPERLQLLQARHPEPVHHQGLVHHLEPERLQLL